MRVTQIHRYPVKSMRAESLDKVHVEPWGLAGDRRWMVVDGAGECITAPEHPMMLLLHTELFREGVRIRAPHDVIEAQTPTTVNIQVSVHGRTPFEACLAAPEAHAWLSVYLDEDVRLVYIDDPTRRRLNPVFSRPTDSASFQDAYPVLVASESSREQLNAWIEGGRFPEEGPLPMNRFRPNIVVDGEEPFAEDSWRRIRVGSVEFRSPKGSDRCVMTTRDMDTARGGKEPIASLARHRKYDGVTWFGMNLIPDTLGEIHVGDQVEILETGESDGPPR